MKVSAFWNTEDNRALILVISSLDVSTSQAGPWSYSWGSEIRHPLTHGRPLRHAQPSFASRAFVLCFTRSRLLCHAQPYIPSRALFFCVTRSRHLRHARLYCVFTDGRLLCRDGCVVLVSAAGVRSRRLVGCSMLWSHETFSWLPTMGYR